MCIKRALVGFSVVVTVILGAIFVGCSKQSKDGTAIIMERKVEYEVVKLDGDMYIAVSDQFDKQGVREGLEFTPYQAGKRLNIGDKVSGYWEGSRLKAVVPQ